jgi:hypothetical protein
MFKLVAFSPLVFQCMSLWKITALVMFAGAGLLIHTGLLQTQQCLLVALYSSVVHHQLTARWNARLTAILQYSVQPSLEDHITSDWHYWLESSKRNSLIQTSKRQTFYVPRQLENLVFASPNHDNPNLCLQFVPQLFSKISRQNGSWLVCYFHE